MPLDIFLFAWITRQSAALRRCCFAAVPPDVAAVATEIDHDRGKDSRPLAEEGVPHNEVGGSQRVVPNNSKSY